MAAFAEPAGEGPVTARRALIDRVFAGDRVADIIAALDGAGDDWASKTAATMRTKSPTSLKVALAQVRRRGGILQHGSLPLAGDVGQICDALAYPDEPTREQARRHVRERAINLTDALGGVVVSWQEAADALVEGFRAALGLSFDAPVSLSDAERADAERLAATTYASVRKL